MRRGQGIQVLVRHIVVPHAKMQDQLRATKLWLQKQFKTSGIQLEPAALALLVDAVQDVEDPEAYVHSLIEEIEAGKLGGAGGAGEASSMQAAVRQANGS